MNRSASTVNDKTACKRCGDCCRHNGFIPPLLWDKGTDDDAPEWLKVLVKRLSFSIDNYIRQKPCIFLIEDNRCAIEDVYKPIVCREYDCHEET